MGNDFNGLDTVQFQQRMKPFALKIYQAAFPGCTIEDLREEGVKVHILDKEFGIDSLLKFKSGQWISLQEKYRRNEHLKRFGDFTQEYMNASGTQFQSEGEWFKLGAQLYFYGWANENETGFERWLILNIPKYKIIVERLGGLDAIGKLRTNNTHGRASFYGIPIHKISPAIVFHDLTSEMLGGA